MNYDHKLFKQLCDECDPDITITITHKKVTFYYNRKIVTPKEEKSEKIKKPYEKYTEEDKKRALDVFKELKSSRKTEKELRKRYKLKMSHTSVLRIVKDSNDEEALLLIRTNKK